MKVESPALAKLSGVRHAFFTREGGVSEGIYASLNGGVGSSYDQTRVSENRRRMAEQLGTGHGDIATPHQIHSAKVAIATECWPKGKAPHADAVVTAVKGLAILRGYRNLPRGDVAALARAVAAFSTLAHQAFADVSDAEINPLLVKRDGEGVVAVDGLVVLGE